jgi:hypothetical protein
VSEATAEVIPKEEDLAEAAGRELRTGLSQRDVDGPADEAAATCCLSRGLVDLGITFALRAARAYHHEGDAAAVSRVLAAASTHAPAMSSRAMASLARARAGAGELTEAADMLVAAAERSRNEGRVEQALDYCLAASRWHAAVRDVHRTWCLALLASGDPDGAVGHLARWGSELTGGIETARSQLEAACGPGRAGELIARAGRLADGTAVSPAARPAAGWDRAFLAPGLAGRREQLVRLLTEAQIEVVEASCESGVSDALVRALPLDLLILPIGPKRCPRPDWFRSIHAHPGLEFLPILGALAGELDVDQLETLRMLGLAGVLDLGASAEQIMFRVSRVLRRDCLERRVHTRIPVAFDVTVDADGVVTTQRAESLSSGGLRLRSSLALEVNREIRLRFRPEPEMASIRANARVVNCTPAAVGEGGHAVGVFFLDLSASDRMRLDSLVARRLAGTPPAAQGRVQTEIEQERPLGVRRVRPATNGS